MKLKVTKVHGNNNTFILLFNPNLINNFFNNKNAIKKICSISKNELVDGLLVLKYLNKNDISLDYYNNDGTWESFCANGLRCAALFIYKKFGFPILNIKCGDGIHITKKIGKNFSTSMLKPTYYGSKIIVDNLEGYFINAGAKHFVLSFKKNYQNKKTILNIAHKIRYNKSIFPQGTNVNFYQILNRKLIKIITYEKGIEKIVKSCASGSFACAFHLSKNKIINKNVTVLNDGGELKIKFSKNYEDNYIISTAVIEDECNLDI